MATIIGSARIDERGKEYKEGTHDHNMKGETKMKELKETIDLMNSEDYKERFKAEYWQTKIRHDRLHDMIVRYEAGTLNFEPTCNIDVFKKQITNMANYLYVLEVRAEIEGITL